MSISRRSRGPKTRAQETRLVEVLKAKKIGEFRGYLSGRHGLLFSPPRRQFSQVGVLFVMVFPRADAFPGVFLRGDRFALRNPPGRNRVDASRGELPAHGTAASSLRAASHPGSAGGGGLTRSTEGGLTSQLPPMLAACWRHGVRFWVHL